MLYAGCRGKRLHGAFACWSWCQALHSYQQLKGGVGRAAQGCCRHARCEAVGWGPVYGCTLGVSICGAAVYVSLACGIVIHVAMFVCYVYTSCLGLEKVRFYMFEVCGSHAASTTDSSVPGVTCRTDAHTRLNNVARVDYKRKW